MFRLLSEARRSFVPHRAIAAHPEAEARITPAKRAESVEQVAGAMFRMLDANSDQMLTYAEINEGTTRKRPVTT